MKKQKKRRAERAIILLDKFDKLLKSEFEDIRDLPLQTTTKGTKYEKIVCKFLQKYFGGQLEFYNKVQLIDANLAALEVSRSGKNEFDVVGIYNRAIPKVILKEDDDVNIIPYDATAVVIEVKQTLKSKDLRDALDKLSSLDKLEITKNRWTDPIAKEDAFLERPLRWIFAFESQISRDTINKLLSQYPTGFDFLSILKDQIIGINSRLPIYKKMPPGKTGGFGLYKEHSVFVTLLIYFIASLPIPEVVDCSQVFYNLVLQKHLHPNYFGKDV